VTVREFELEFVEFIPRELAAGVLYISMEYATASHLCACGCGARAVTPLGAADWLLTYNGRVSLSPSIGNGQNGCGSHYLVRENRVVWCRPMSRDEARRVHQRDTAQRDQSYNPAPRLALWTRLRNWLHRSSERT
jgi:hypothetical protein